MKLKQIVFGILAACMTASSLLLATPAIISSALEATEAAEDTLPAQYCMRDEYIIYAQNQDKHGYCWNFASTMAAATTIMKATGEYYDFSELWTGVSSYVATGQYSKMGAGGTITYHYNAMKKSGLMLEADLPYQYSYNVSNENVTDYYNFYERYASDDLANCLVKDSSTSFSRSKVEEIKRHIYENGSIYMAFSFRTGFLESGGAYCLTPNQTNTNSSHAVSVIGWDDNFEKEFYLNGETTPTVFKGAWIILNSYTEKSGNDGISLIFYDDKNISSIQGYRYEPDTSGDLYFYDKIEEGYAYPTSLVGKYYGDFTAEMGVTKQKNIFYNDVNLTYSYIASSNTGVQSIDIYLGDQNVTDLFDIRIDNAAKKFCISKSNAVYGQYKVLVTYGNGEKTDTYLNNFFVTHGLTGEEIEYDHASSSFSFRTGRDLEFYSFIVPNKTYVIYTSKLSGEISFLPTEQSVYSEINMSLPKISYEITNGESCTKTHTLTSDSGYDLTYTFVFEYCEDTSMQPVNIYYDLDGGVNHPKNYSYELASPTKDLVLYAPTRPGYTFAGWYLDYGNGSKKIPESNGVYSICWDDIYHLGENPGMNALSYYKEYYNNSSTVFVYAHWEEAEYHNVDITIIGEGSAQIHEDISVSANSSVRYLFKPGTNQALIELTINGTAVRGDEFLKILQYGLELKNLKEDVAITATFAQGVYLSLQCGENIKNAYIVGTKDGETKKFYDGDFIPASYFSDVWFNGILRPRKLEDPSLALIDNLEAVLKPIDPINPSPSLPSISLPSYGTQFSLVVELPEDREGYTYVLDDIGSYSVVEKGVFKKNITIAKSDELAEIRVGAATEKPIEKVTIRYTTGNYTQDHYLSPDINGTIGIKNTATFDAGQIVYLFIKKPQDTAVYYYKTPEGFEEFNGQWYRKAYYVSADASDLGTIAVSRTNQSYVVTWKNYDGSLIYSEKYNYGARPTFYDSTGASKDVPTRPDAGLYSYVFLGWDKELNPVSADITYTAVYETVLRKFNITVEPTENGTILSGESNALNYLEQKTYVFAPNPGYKVKDVRINGESVGAVSSYIFTNVRSDQTLFVEFEKIRYDVNIICGENGSADPAGALTVVHGENLLIKISPADYFHIDTIKLNGEIVASAKQLCIENVTQNILVEITFKPATFQITTKSDKNGSVTASFAVAAGENATIDFDAKLFHKVKNIKIDGVSIGAMPQYVLFHVMREHTVSVEYEINVWAIVLASLAAAVLIFFVVWICIAAKRRKERRRWRRKYSILRMQKNMQK